MTRRDLVKAISPNRRGVDKSAWNPKELSRGEAESVVKAVFEEITEALNRVETVKLPFGTFEVKQHNRPPLRGWFLSHPLRFPGSVPKTASALPLSLEFSSLAARSGRQLKNSYFPTPKFVHGFVQVGGRLWQFSDRPLELMHRSAPAFTGLFTLPSPKQPLWRLRLGLMHRSAPRNGRIAVTSGEK